MKSTFQYITIQAKSVQSVASTRDGVSQDESYAAWTDRARISECDKRENGRSWACTSKDVIHATDTGSNPCLNTGAEPLVMTANRRGRSDN